ncbi:MAG: Y-family DNA polymerase [Waddliaceae bacterium]
MFALVDCNNFYVSCERVFHPKWIGKPVVVLSNNDGCVIARSNEAKAIGIPMGAPYFRYKQLLEAHSAIICSSNYTLYADMSARVMKLLEDFTPNRQVYSIDEAFLLMKEKNPLSYGQTIRKTILQCTGIPVSIGIAPTKTLAKIANHCAKKDGTTAGVVLLDTLQAIDERLERLPVTDIWGIGERYGIKLNRLGVITAKDFRDADDSLIKKQLTTVGLRTAWELRGISCLPLEEIPLPKKSVTCSRAFGHPIDNLEELNEAISSYTARAAEKIREQKLLTTTMIVFLELHPYIKHSSRCFHLRASFPEPLNFTPALIHYAKAAAKALFRKGCRYRKAGIILDNLVPDHSFQYDFFTPKDLSREKQQHVMSAVDRMNEQFGYTVIHTAAEGVNRSWKMKRNYCSAHFTTNWNELLVITI